MTYRVYGVLGVMALKKAPAILLPALMLLSSAPPAAGQRLQLLDVPGSLRPDAVASLPLSSALRAALEKSLETRDYTAAENLLVGEIGRNPKSPQLLTFVGGVFFLDGKYLNAAVAMKKAEALAPLNDRSRFTLAMAYVTLNHRDWARPELEKLARSDSANALYPYWLSRLDYDAMDYPSAIRHAQKALELDPNFMKAYDNLGLCYEAQGQYEKAIESYHDAVRLNKQKAPCSAWPPLNLAALLIKLDRLGEAEGFVNEALRCDPRLPQAHYQRGFLLEKQKRYDAAVEELKQAATLDSHYPEPYYLLGRIYEQQGDPKKSAATLAIFQKLKQAQPRGRPR